MGDTNTPPPTQPGLPEGEMTEGERGRNGEEEEEELDH